MVEKKPYWAKKDVIKTAKFQTAPVSLSIDEEIQHHIRELRLIPTILFREFICEKSGKTIQEIEKDLKKHLLESIKVDREFLSKDFRRFCINKIKSLSKKPEIKKRMEEKEKEE